MTAESDPDGAGRGRAGVGGGEALLQASPLPQSWEVSFGLPLLQTPPPTSHPLSKGAPSLQGLAAGAPSLLVLCILPSEGITATALA